MKAINRKAHKEDAKDFIIMKMPKTPNSDFSIFPERRFAR